MGSTLRVAKTRDAPGEYREEKEPAGMPAVQTATRATEEASALLEFGGIEEAKEECLDAG